MIFVLGLAADPQGEWEAEVLQGELVRLSASWTPSAEQEGRWWWEPGGGSTWVRVGGFQAGPLTGVAAVEGAKGWGPGTRLSSGNWGAAFLRDWGFWAVQKPDSFEAGGQYRADLGIWTLAAGGERVWRLELEEGPVWADQARAGASWSAPGLGGGVELAAGRDAEGRREEAANARLSVDRGAWEAGVGGGWGARPWGRWHLGWRTRELTLTGTADSREGPEVLARVALDVLGLTVGSELWIRKEAKAETALLLEGGEGEGSWSGEWRLSEGRYGLKHQIAACWRTPAFEVEARWKTESPRLGWMGAGAAFGLSWKMLW